MTYTPASSHFNGGTITSGLAINSNDNIPLSAIGFGGEFDVATSGHELAFYNTVGVNSADLFLQDNTGRSAALDTQAGLSTRPPVSATSTLSLGVAYQNQTGSDLVLCVVLLCTANTSVVIALGVGSTSTPTQQNIITGGTATGYWPVPIYLPDQYYALLSKSGTGTVSVAGQSAMSV